MGEARRRDEQLTGDCAACPGRVPRRAAGLTADTATPLAGQGLWDALSCHGKTAAADARIAATGPPSAVGGSGSLIAVNAAYPRRAIRAPTTGSAIRLALTAAACTLPDRNITTAGSRTPGGAAPSVAGPDRQVPKASPGRWTFAGQAALIRGMTTTEALT
ncbi:hypothetical protein [Paracoccus spongiarum]|uniref:Uncharacterized protein n=1 Tax=Paracoccus spongiarum TaxID=3064387 RepID=A0ABT9JAY7_9RHOB|nr:hypothetical protein [Paracoccus sp. 2205BS29-5]MDP5306780.1 hypothetical protein [Paracoccus sp. 2205BS29-5]